MVNRARHIARILRVLVVLTSCAMCGLPSTAQEAQPIATLDLSAAKLSGCDQAGSATVAFTSDATIAVSVCGNDCSLALVQWDGVALKLSARSVTDSRADAIYPENQGLIFQAGLRGPMSVYTADLSKPLALPPTISLISDSGKTLAERSGAGWKIYRFAGTLQLVQESAGRLLSISDELRVLQIRDNITVETLEGTRLGSLTVPSEKGCIISAKLIGGNRLYLNDCKVERIVDFNGNTLSQLNPPKGCCFSDDEWPADGKRMLFDYRDRKVFQLRNMGEIIRMLTTLGMAGEEWPNREVVSVVDTLTGKSCFDWRRSFTKDNYVAFGRTAAISPSGEYVAIVANEKLSMYRLPAHCEGAMTAPRGK